MKKVLFKPNEQSVSAPIDAQFVRLGVNYRAKLEVEVIAILASIPCEKCAKSTRDIMKEMGVIISNDDMEVDILETLSNLSNDEARSALDPSYVFLISNASIIEELSNSDKMTDIPLNGELGTALDAYVKSVLIGHKICDGCFFTPNYLNTMLDC